VGTQVVPPQTAYRKSKEKGYRMSERIDYFNKLFSQASKTYPNLGVFWSSLDEEEKIWFVNFLSLCLGEGREEELIFPSYLSGSC